jgi:hypothetical protein
MRKVKRKSVAKPESPKKLPVFKCSFCGKTEDSVRKLICGPGAFICNECIQLSNDILLAEPNRPRPPLTKAKPKGSNNGRSNNAFRERIFEIIVEQAIDSALWQDGCKAAMAVNKITTKEVEAEVQKRLKLARSSPDQFHGNQALMAEQRAFLVLNHITEELGHIKTRLETMEKRLRNGR